MLGVRRLSKRLRRSWCRPFGGHSVPASRPAVPGRTFTYRLAAGLWIVAALTTITVSAMAVDLTVEQLKAKVAAASVGDRPHLCVQIAERQLAASDKLYSTGDVEKAQAALTDVVAFSELARDYAIQTHKYQKQSEIAMRTMSRKLGDIKHLVGHDDQAPIQDAINRLQRVRDDLLMAMFPKGAK